MPVAWINMRDAHHNTIRNCVFDGAKIYNDHGSQEIPPADEQFLVQLSP